MSSLSTPLLAGLVSVMTVFYVSGAGLLAKAAKADEPFYLALAYVCYLAGNSAFYWLVKHDGLGMTTILSSVAQTVLVLLVAKLFLGEVLTAQKIVGAAIAVVGVMIVMLPPFNAE